MEEKEDKVINKKFAWILIGSIAALSLVVYWVGINSNGGSKSSGNNLDGTYYVYHRQNNTVIEDNILKIDGETALFKDAFWVKNGDKNEGVMWHVDTKKQVIVVRQTSVHEFPYILRDGVLTFDNDDYVEKNSETYRKAKKMTEWDYENN